MEYMIKYQADLFNEVLAGTVDALYGMGKISLSESLSDIKAAYSGVIKRFGIYEEFDKAHEMEILRSRLRSLLDRIFRAMPLRLEYKGFVAIYDPDKHRKAVLVMRGNREVRIAASFFFILKCFIENMGRFVTQSEIEQFLREHGENVGGGEDSGIRTYVARLRKDYGFEQFITRGPRGKGWKLEI